MPRGIYKRTEKLKKQIVLNTQKYRFKEGNKPLGGFKTRFTDGHKVSEGMREKISEGHIGMKKPWVSNAWKGKIGNRHPAWKGGISFEPYSTDWTETLRRSIRERDNYICQLCSQYGNTVHHKDYDKKNCDPKNLITLCRKCNAKVNANRNYWIKFWQTKNKK